MHLFNGIQPAYETCPLCARCRVGSPRYALRASNPQGSPGVTSPDLPARRAHRHGLLIAPGLPGQTDLPPVPQPAMRTFYALFAPPAPPRTRAHVCARTSVSVAARMLGRVRPASPPWQSRRLHVGSALPPSNPPLLWAICGISKLRRSAPNVFHICSASLIQIPGTTQPAQSEALGGKKAPTPVSARTHTRT